MSVISLDPGTANLVVAFHGDNGNVKTVRMRNVFIEVPDNTFTRKMLEQLQAPYFEIDGKLYLAGNEAFELANTFGKELRRPMSSGVISSNESDAIPMITAMVERLLVEAGADKDTVCAYSCPADPVDSPIDCVFHQSIVEGILRKNEIQPQKVTEGHAVVLSELGHDQFTGVGISWGGGMVNICVSYRSIPVVSFSSARAGDWIDEKAAQACGIVKPRMTSAKESADFSLVGTPKNRQEAALVSYYEAAIQYTLENITKRLRDGNDMPNFSEPVEIVCAGGTASPKGFAEMFNNVLKRSGFDIPVKRVRVASEPLFTVVRGALIAASL